MAGTTVIGFNISPNIGAQHFQKSRKCHELPRKCFHFKPLTPTHPGGAVVGNTGREGRRRRVGVRKLEGRNVEGGRIEGGGSEVRRHEGGLSSSKGAGSEEAGREGGRREGGDVGCSRDEEGRERGKEGEHGGERG